MPTDIIFGCVAPRWSAGDVERGRLLAPAPLDARLRVSLSTAVRPLDRSSRIGSSSLTAPPVSRGQPASEAVAAAAHTFAPAPAAGRAAARSIPRPAPP